jgi:hypothetical protein
MKRGIAALTLLVVVPMLADAGEVRSQFAVSAVIPARVSLEAVSPTPALVVSAADFANGFLDFEATYRVRSNDPSGYLIRFAPRLGLATSIEVSGLGSQVRVGDDIVEVTQPAAPRPRDLHLRFRLRLDPAAVPGTYEVPVQVSATVL